MRERYGPQEVGAINSAENINVVQAPLAPSPERRVLCGFVPIPVGPEVDGAGGGEHRGQKFECVELLPSGVDLFEDKADGLLGRVLAEADHRHHVIADWLEN